MLVTPNPILSLVAILAFAVNTLLCVCAPQLASAAAEPADTAAGRHCHAPATPAPAEQNDEHPDHPGCPHCDGAELVQPPAGSGVDAVAVKAAPLPAVLLPRLLDLAPPTLSPAPAPVSTPPIKPDGSLLRQHCALIV